MSDQHDDDSFRPPRPPSEGVRIIGAEEAARALEEGQAEGRRPEDAPRFGDVPPPPEGPRTGYRFPLPEEVDPAEAVPRPPVASDVEPGGPPTQQVELPHWTEPPSGEVPRILAGEDDEEDEGGWSATSSRGPRWRDTAADWDDADFDDDMLDDDEVRMGVLDVNRTEHSDMFSFDEPEELEEPEPEPAPRTVATTTPIRTRPPADFGGAAAPASGRDMGAAVGIGLALLVAAILLFRAGPVTAGLIVLASITLCAVEVFDVLRRAQYRPATLLGLTATVSLFLASYNKGETAVPLVLAMTVVFTFLWYLFDVVKARPTINVAATLLGFLWVGLLGAFGGLLLGLPDRIGVGAFFGGILCTVGYDVGALFVGSQVGSRPLMPEVSPNKTVEGLVGGMTLAVVLGAVLGAFMHPWSIGSGALLGLVVAVVAPLGDLAQSMIKRDLGLKDMGTIFPGHGGAMDRFDGMLFMLPATYYLVKLLHL